MRASLVAGCFIVMRSREQANAQAALIPLADAAGQVRIPGRFPTEQYIPALQEVPAPLWPAGVVFKAGPRVKLTIPVDQDEQ